MEVSWYVFSWNWESNQPPSSLSRSQNVASNVRALLHERVVCVGDVGGADGAPQHDQTRQWWWPNRLTVWPRPMVNTSQINTDVFSLLARTALRHGCRMCCVACKCRQPFLSALCYWTGLPCVTSIASPKLNHPSFGMIRVTMSMFQQTTNQRSRLNWAWYSNGWPISAISFDIAYVKFNAIAIEIGHYIRNTMVIKETALMVLDSIITNDLSNNDI